jgi:hypothetical protein
MGIGSEKKSTGRKPSEVSLGPPQIPCILIWGLTRAAAVEQSKRPLFSESVERDNHESRVSKDIEVSCVSSYFSQYRRKSLIISIYKDGNPSEIWSKYLSTNYEPWKFQLHHLVRYGVSLYTSWSGWVKIFGCTLYNFGVHYVAGTGSHGVTFILNLCMDKVFFCRAELYGNKMRSRHGRPNFGSDQTPSVVKHDTIMWC